MYLWIVLLLWYGVLSFHILCFVIFFSPFVSKRRAADKKGQKKQVSLDPATKRPVKTSPLVAETAAEKALFAKGENNYLAKKEAAKMALRKQTPNDEESDLIHALWLQGLDYHGISLSLLHINLPCTWK